MRTRRVPPSVRCHDRAVLPNRTGIAACAFPRTGELSPARSSIRKLVSPFVVVWSPAPPGTTPTSLDCLAENIAQPSGRLLLRPHSPATAFQSPGQPRPGTGHHSGSRNGSCVSHRLRSVARVTSRYYPAGPQSDARFFRTGIVYSRSHVSTDRLTADFWGPNVEASPYPSVLVFRSLASSPAKLTGKPLRAFRG